MHGCDSRLHRASWRRCRWAGSRAIVLAACVTACLTSLRATSAAEASLKAELAQLATERGFIIDGIEAFRETRAAPRPANGLNQLETALRDFGNRIGGNLVIRHESFVPSLAMLNPVDQARITSAYGPRWHPVLNRPDRHSGIDLAAPAGTPIRAPAEGVVVEAGRRGAYGRYIRIRHDTTYETAYGHLAAFAPVVREGARIRRGAIIGFVGESGRATGPHLHFELWVNGVPTDPRATPVGARHRVQIDDELWRAFAVARMERVLHAILGGSSSAEQPCRSKAGFTLHWNC